MKTTLFEYCCGQITVKSEKVTFPPNQANLILAFGDKQVLAQEDFYPLLRSQFPEAQIAMCTTAGHICNEEVTEKNLEVADLKSGGLVKKLLREFCCYSLEKFNKQLKQYRAVYQKLKAKAGIITAKRQEKIKLTEQIANRIDSIGGNTQRFLKLIQEIDHLNFLNDNIDVKYSFKSWPGLIHYTVFANAMQRTGATTSITTTGQLLLNL